MRPPIKEKQGTELNEQTLSYVSAICSRTLRNDKCCKELLSRLIRKPLLAWEYQTNQINTFTLVVLRRPVVPFESPLNQAHTTMIFRQVGNLNYRFINLFNLTASACNEWRKLKAKARRDKKRVLEKLQTCARDKGNSALGFGVQKKLIISGA